MSNEIELDISIPITTTWPEQCKTKPITNPISDIAQKLMGFAQGLKDATCTVVHYLTPNRSFSNYFAICRRSPSLSTTPTDGRTPLHLAITSNDLKRAKELLELSADPNTVDSVGVTPLHDAIRSENIEIVELLAQNGAQVDAKDSDGWTPLHIAACFKQPEMVKKLLDLKADPNIANSMGHTPLHKAVWSENTEIVNILAQNGAQVDAKDSDGWTPLHIAACFKQPEMVKKLLDLKADPNIANSMGHTPLHKAVWSENTEIVNILAQNGAQVEAKDSLGWTPLHLAAAFKQLEMITNLRNLGADLNATDNQGDTPLHKALKAESVETAQMLVQYGAQLNTKNSNGQTPLHLAAALQNTQSIECLLTHGGTYDPALISSDGRALITLITILLTAQCQGSRTLTQITTANPPTTQSELIKKVKGVFSRRAMGIAGMGMLQVGAGLVGIGIGKCLYELPNISLSSFLSVGGSFGLALAGFLVHEIAYGKSSLHYAVDNGNLAEIENLVKSGANIEARDSNGFTPLYHAVLNSKLDVAEKLIALGADVDAPYGKHRIAPLYLMFIRKAFANTKALEAAIQASNGTPQERLDREHLANRFALDGASELLGSLDELAGTKLQAVNLTIKDAALSFYSPLIDGLQNGDDRAWNYILQKLSTESGQQIKSLGKPKIIEILKNALEAVINSVPKNVEAVLDKHVKGLPIAIAIRWPGESGQADHAVSLVLCGDKIALCNKERESAPGIVISTIGKPEALRKALEHCIPETTEDYFTKEIVTELGLSQYKHLEQKPQNGPNCGIANTNSMGPLAVYMQLAPLVGDEAASEFFKIFKRFSTTNDRLSNTHSYLSKHEQPQSFDVDVGLIGQIYSKTTSKPEVDQQIRDMIEKWAAKRNIDLKAAVILGIVQAFLGKHLDPEKPLPNLSLVSRAYELKTGSDDVDSQLRSMIDLWAQKRNLQWQEGSQKTTSPHSEAVTNT